MIITKTNLLQLPFENNLNDILGATNQSGNNPSFVNGQFGRAVDFNGTSNYLEYPHDSKYDLGDEFCFSFWINPGTWSGSSSNRIIYGKRLWGQGADKAGIVIRGFNNVFNVNFFGTGFFSITTSLPPTNQWTHVVINCDRSGTLEIYYNLIEQLSTDMSSRSQHSINNTENITIGRRPDINAAFYAGILDSFNLWKTKLNFGDIKRVRHGLHPLNG